MESESQNVRISNGGDLSEETERGPSVDIQDERPLVQPSGSNAAGTGGPPPEAQFAAEVMEAQASAARDNAVPPTSPPGRG